MTDEKQNGKGLNWPTVALIIASGGVNLLGTHTGNVQITEEQRAGLRQMADLHNELDDFKRWQRVAGENQQLMMKNDSRLLEETHEIAVRLDRLKALDQMRGAPQ